MRLAIARCSGHHVSLARTEHPGCWVTSMESHILTSLVNTGKPTQGNPFPAPTLSQSPRKWKSRLEMPVLKFKTYTWCILQRRSRVLAEWTEAAPPGCPGFFPGVPGSRQEAQLGRREKGALAPLPKGASQVEATCQRRRCGFDPWVRKIPWRRKWQPTPAFLPGKFHGQRSLAGYSPWGHKEPDNWAQHRRDLRPRWVDSPPPCPHRLPRLDQWGKPFSFPGCALPPRPHPALLGALGSMRDPAAWR